MKPDAFRSYRRRHKVSVLELSLLTGVNWQPIVRYEQGEGTLPAETVEMLVDTIMGFGELKEV